MIERAVQFGTGARLAGVLTEPSAGYARAAAPPVILINSGILHKVGSCRLYVQLARALADQGFVTLRFDLSGLGDSEGRRDAMPFEESSVAETRDAMDYLHRARGATEFILGGLCSGADVSHMTAVDDDRVVGIASIDARTHLTLGYWWRLYAPKVLSVRKWKGVLGRLLFGNRRSMKSGLDAHLDDQAFELPTYVRVIPPRDELAAELRTIVGRGSMLLYVFTDGLDCYNYEGQHRRAFRDVPFGTLMTERHLRGADHIITDLALQRRAVDMHVEWALGVAEAAQRRRASEPQFDIPAVI